MTTIAEKRHMGRVAALGCVMCHHLGLGDTPAQVHHTRVPQFLAGVDSFKAQLQASLGQVQYKTQAFTAQVEAWRAKASAQVADAEMQSRFADMQTRTNIAYSEMQVSQYNALMQHAIQEAQIALEQARAMGAFTAQLAAGAMSALHVSAGISGSGSATTTDSRSTTYNTSYNTGGG